MQKATLSTRKCSSRSKGKQVKINAKLSLCFPDLILQCILILKTHVLVTWVQVFEANEVDADYNTLRYAYDLIHKISSAFEPHNYICIRQFGFRRQQHRKHVLFINYIIYLRSVFRIFHTKLHLSKLKSDYKQFQAQSI